MFENAVQVIFPSLVFTNREQNCCPKLFICIFVLRKHNFLFKKSQYIFVTPFNVFLKQFLLDDPYFEIALINITDYNCNLKRATAVKKPLSSGPRFCLVVEILFIYL